MVVHVSEVKYKTKYKSDDPAKPRVIIEFKVEDVQDITDEISQPVCKVKVGFEWYDVYYSGQSLGTGNSMEYMFIQALYGSNAFDRTLLKGADVQFSFSLESPRGNVAGYTEFNVPAVETEYAEALWYPEEVPPAAVIHGTVTDLVTGDWMSGASISFTGYSTMSGLDGSYSLNLTDFEGGGGEFMVTKLGYEGYTEFMTVGPTDDVSKDVVLTPVGAPPPVSVAITGISADETSLYTETSTTVHFTSTLLGVISLPVRWSIFLNKTGESNNVKAVPAMTLYEDASQLINSDITIPAGLEGTYDLVITAYNDDTGEVIGEGTAGAYFTILMLPPPKNGILEILSVPSDVQIYLNGVLQFKKTPAEFTLSIGAHEVVLHEAGYEDFEGTVDVFEGEKTTLDVTLKVGAPAEETTITTPIYPKPVRYNAWKYILKTVDATTGEEMHAKIFINDEDTGSWTPFSFFLEPLKTFTIRFERHGYLPAETTITTEALPSAS